MRGTQLAQKYRQDANQLNTIDRDIMQNQSDFVHSENIRNNAIDAFGGLTKLVGKAGDELTHMDKGIQFGKQHGLESRGWLDAINPFKKGGFGMRYGKEGGQDYTIEDLNKTRGLMDYAKIKMGDQAPGFDETANMALSDNPALNMGSYIKKTLDAATNTKVSDAPEVVDDTPTPKDPNHQRMDEVIQGLKNRRNEPTNYVTTAWLNQNQPRVPNLNYGSTNLNLDDTEEQLLQQQGSPGYGDNSRPRNLEFY